jgi:hypothetical protein
MIFWLVLKLEISESVIISCRILVSFRRLFRRLSCCMVHNLEFQ